MNNHQADVRQKVAPVVCIFGDYDPGYTREIVISRALEISDISVLECNCFIKYSKGVPANKLSYTIKAYRNLLAQLRDEIGVVTHFLVPHNNHLIVPLAVFLARKHGKKVIADAFDPAYQTARIGGINVVRAVPRFIAERLALRLSDHVLVLTEEFKNLYMNMHNIEAHKISVIPIGANERKFQRRAHVINADDIFHVLYWGNFAPHHGVPIIVRAAALLKEYANIHFTLAGNGPRREGVQRLAEDNAINNVEFRGFVPDAQLVDLVSQAHVCLGIFSNHIKAQCSITNKVSEALAMGKSVITMQGPATQRVFKHKKDIYLVPPEDPQSLAEAVLQLKADGQLRERMEVEARRTFIEQFSEEAIGRYLLDILHKV